jgi:transposase-like protein
VPSGLDRGVPERGTHTTLGYLPGVDKPDAATNNRNGGISKTVLTGDGKLRIERPCDRDGSLELLSLPKHERRFTYSQTGMDVPSR